MTVEASLVMSLFLMSFYVLFSLFSLLELQVEMQFSLEKAVREAAIYQAGGSSALLRVKSALSHDLKEKTGFLDFDREEVVLSEGKPAEAGEAAEFLDVAVSYQAGPRLSLFGSLKGNYRQRCRRRLWSGKEQVGGNACRGEEEKKEESVYVTQNGSVYHKTRDCTYLKLSVSQVTEETVGGYRSSDGSKYKPCDRCVGKKGMSSVLYIAEDGAKYHSDRNCSGLKRWVRKVPLSEAEGKRPCSRCGG